MRRRPSSHTPTPCVRVRPASDLSRVRGRMPPGAAPAGIELEGTDCDYVRGGKFAVLDDADSALLGYTGPGPRAPSAPASAAKAAAPAPAPTAAAPAPPAAGGSGAAAPLAVLSAGAAALLACLLP